MAMTAAERQREKRARDKMKEDERLARLLSRRITLDLYHATDDKLKALLARTGIDEPQDLITRLIHNAAKMNDELVSRLTRLP